MNLQQGLETPALYHYHVMMPCITYVCLFTCLLSVSELRWKFYEEDLCLDHYCIPNAQKRAHDNVNVQKILVKKVVCQLHHTWTDNANVPCATQWYVCFMSIINSI